MKKEFAVLESCPRIEFIMDRDSVCSSDDCDTHKTSVETYSLIDTVALAEELSSGYLPSVAGFGHWWECILNGIVVAKILSNGKAEKIQEVDFKETNTVYFKYHSATF